MSGLELLDALHVRGSKLPVIAITGRSDASLKLRAVRAGAVTLLDKPVTDDMLMNWLSRALAQAEFRAL